MKKYLMLMGLILLGLTMAAPPDPWTGYKYGIAECKASYLQDAYDSWADPGCMSPATYSALSSTISQIGYPDGGILDQLGDTAYGAGECYDGTTDWACVARYRQQFRSQYNTFNTLAANAVRLSIVAGWEASNPDGYDCISREEFISFYANYMTMMSVCNAYWVAAS